MFRPSAHTPIRPAPVLIVGAGPTGLTAALELSRFGIPVRLIDRCPQPSGTSRAIGIQARTLELLGQRGLADALVQRGHKATHGIIHAGGRAVMRLDFSRIPSRYNFMLLLSQAETEHVLRQAVERTGIVVERGVELVALAQEPLSQAPAPVRAVLRRADGSLEECPASWLISAEGAHSLVRTTLDLPFEGQTLDRLYALGDLLVEGDLADDALHIFSSRHGLLALFPLGGRRVRLIAGDAGDQAALPPGPPSLDTLQRLLNERAPGAPDIRELGWSTWFRINSRMVPRLRAGRLLLGGDAAHIHSPAGAQGMNTGIQDMIDLGWKLAFVIKGEAPDSLLDSTPKTGCP